MSEEINYISFIKRLNFLEKKQPYFHEPQLNPHDITYQQYNPALQK